MVERVTTAEQTLIDCLQEKDVFSPSKHQGRLWAPPSLLFKGYRESSARRLNGRSVKLTTPIKVVPAL